MTQFRTIKISYIKNITAKITDDFNFCVPFLELLPTPCRRSEGRGQSRRDTTSKGRFAPGRPTCSEAAARSRRLRSPRQKWVEIDSFLYDNTTKSLTTPYILRPKAAIRRKFQVADRRRPPEQLAASFLRSKKWTFTQKHSQFPSKSAEIDSNLSHYRWN